MWPATQGLQVEKIGELGRAQVLESGRLECEFCLCRFSASGYLNSLNFLLYL